MDLISVIMPFYKKKLFFYQSFYSVVNQTYKNIEIVIIYDDIDTNDLLYIKSLVSDKKNVSIIVNDKNLGVAKSRNKGIENANGKFIAFLDCDDVWTHNKLKLQYNFMMENKLRISHTNYKIINFENKIIGENISKNNPTYSQLINSCDIGLSTVMSRKEVFKISKFKEIETKEDYALWLELSRKGENFICINESLTLWRKTSNSLSSSLISKFVNGFKVYNKFEKKNLLISFFLVINLGLHYIKKNINQKKKI